MPEGDLNQNPAAAEIRFVFVEMLFALTIAEVATQVATMVSDGVGIRAGSSSYAHLLLATMLVAASWIGWKNSVAKGNQVPVSNVFDLGFLVLVLDVALVVCYFILVRGAEKPHDGIIIHSANNETLWILIVFVGYFLWDVLTKAVAPSSERPFLKRLFGPELWKRGRISFVCLLLALLIWFFLRSVSNQGSVVLADTSLLALVFLFRALKDGKKGWIWICLLVLFGSLIAAQRLFI